MRHFLSFRTLALGCAFLSCTASGISQNIAPCGFVNTAQNTQRILAMHTNQGAGSVAPLKCLNKTLSLAIHLVTDSLNNPSVSQQQINDALDTLNHDFAPICLRFKICSQDTIYSYKYYRFDKGLETPEVESIYSVQNIINIYIVGSIVNPGVAGFASPTADYAVLSQVCITDYKCWSHEMGHFFSLMHTFDTSTGNELVNESNCATAGDMICDTRADIDPAPITGCQWTGTNQDANGDYYTPIIGNIMSYHPSGCKTPFTVGQLNQMLNYFITYRNYLF